MLTKLEFDKTTQPYLPPNTYYGRVTDFNTDAENKTFTVILKIDTPEYPLPITLTRRMPDIMSHMDDVNFLLDLNSEKGWPIRYLHNSRDVLYTR